MSVELIDTPDLSTIDVLIIHGFTPTLYQKYSSWLSQHPDKKLFFLEKKIFSFPEDPQVTLYFYREEEDLDLILKKIAWSSAFLSSHFTALSSYKESFSSLKKRWKYLLLGVEMTASEYRNFGVEMFCHTFSNLFQMNSFQKGQKLEKPFSNLPAIICGGGPSLQKALPVLEKLRDKALIFAGGSSLYQVQELCHFAAAIDGTVSGKQFQKFFGWERPFLYQNRVSKETLSLVHGSPVLWGEGEGYGLESWVNQQLGIQEPYFEAGWVVANFLTQIACFWGCDPIIFVGVDLSWKEEKKESVPIQDKKGNTLYTQKDWMIAAHWFKQHTEKHLEKSYFTLSEGLDLGERVKKISLQELEKRSFLQRDLLSKIHGELQSLSTFSIDKKKMDNILQEIQKGLARCQNLSHQELDQLQIEYETKKVSSREKSSFLEGEILYEKWLFPIWKVWGHFVEREPCLPGVEKELDKRIKKVLFFQEAIEMLEQKLKEFSLWK